MFQRKYGSVATGWRAPISVTALSRDVISLIIHETLDRLGLLDREIASCDESAEPPRLIRCSFDFATYNSSVTS